MKFVVGDLPEVVEDEIDGRAVPVRVEMPVTINGRIFPREDVDVWTISARAGRPVTCEVYADRLLSPANAKRLEKKLDARMEIRNEAGRVLAEATDTLAADPRIRFTPPADGIYEIRIHDVAFGGMQHYVYRLTVTEGPFVDHVFPLGGRRGTTVALEALGQALPEVRLRRKFRPTRESCSPRQPTSTACGPTRSCWRRAICRNTSKRSPTTRRRKPNRSTHRPWSTGESTMRETSISGPCALPKATRSISTSAPPRWAGPLDSVLAVVNADGKILAQNDDAAGGQTDSRTSFKAPEDGTYFVRVSERFSSRGGRAFAYRLQIGGTPPAADFQLRLTVDALNVLRQVPETEDDPKKKPAVKPAQLRVDCQRSGGFAGEIELAVEGLPGEVTVEGLKIAAKQARADLKFQAGPKARIGAERGHRSRHG